MNQYIPTLYESILSEAIALSSSEVPSQSNLETFLKKQLGTNFVSLSLDDEKQFSAVLGDKYDGLTLRIDPNSSAAREESMPKSLYTMNTYLYENGKSVSEKPVSLVTILKTLKNYGSNRMKVASNIKIDSNAQFKSPADSYITVGKQLMG
jgi:hypothetical protein